MRPYCDVCHTGHNGTGHRTLGVYPGLLRYSAISPAGTHYPAGTLVRWERVYDPSLYCGVRVFFPDGDVYITHEDDLIVPRSA